MGPVPPVMPHVIIIEDDALVLKLLTRRLEQAGWEVSPLRDGRVVFDRLQEHPADLIVVDLGLPYIDGLALVEGLRARGFNTPVMVLTAYELPHLLETARHAGANDLMSKPYDQEELIARMGRLLAA